MKRYSVTFVDDDGLVRSVKVAAHNPTDAEVKAAKRINEIVKHIARPFDLKDIVNIEPLLRGE